MSKTLLEKNAERISRESIEDLRAIPLADRHAAASKKGHAVESLFPLIGRGSVLGDCIVTHQDAEKAYDYAIKTPWHERVRRALLWLKGKPTRNG